jgi:DNA modification methylase
VFGLFVTKRKTVARAAQAFVKRWVFMDIGLNLHDTMIYKPLGCGAKGSNKSYWQGFEYMFVFSKDKIKTVNLLRDRENISVGLKGGERFGKKSRVHKTAKLGIRDNVWEYPVGFADPSVKTGHPAPFPEALAFDHVLSWSNRGDAVLDPMIGSGTVGAVSERLNRQWIGIEISEKYCEIAAKRIENETKQLKLFA